jgi:hypothetical protein
MVGTVYAAKFARGAGSFEMSAARVNIAGVPASATLTAPFSTSTSNNPSWALNPAEALFVNIGGSGLGTFGNYGVREPGSHACGSFAAHPSNRVRALYNAGDFNAGCYAGQSVWREARTIWIR